MPIIYPIHSTTIAVSTPVYPDEPYELQDDVWDLNFTNLSELVEENNWQLLARRGQEKYRFIRTNILRHDSHFLNNGYGHYRHGNSKDLAFLLILDETSHCVACSCKLPNPDMPSRYIHPNKACRQAKFCPRCAFHDEQEYVKRYKPYFKPRYDYHWITITDPILLKFYSYGLGQEEIEWFKSIESVRSRMLAIQRRGYDWIDGMLISHEAACLNLRENKWNSHLHILIQSSQGVSPDLSEFEENGYLCEIQPIQTISQWEHKLRYLKKPLLDTVRQRYALEYNRQYSEKLFRNAEQAAESLILLFKGRQRTQTTGCFRKPH